MANKEYVLNPYPSFDNETGWMNVGGNPEFRTIYGKLESLRFQTREVLYTRNTIEKRVNMQSNINGTFLTVVLGYRVSQDRINRDGKEVVDVQPIPTMYHTVIKTLLPHDYQNDVSFW